ncbi:MAG: hypothetical protein KGH53_02970, partial [Candidatus Micrarchaeota archaeon]|nr:hypothetical protein [Candidatus Micrarchaeota archaeon]
EQWTQPNGATAQQYSASSNYYAVVGSTKSSSNNTIAYAVIAIAVIAVAGYAIWKRRMAENNKQAAKKAAK